MMIYRIFLLVFARLHNFARLLPVALLFVGVAFGQTAPKQSDKDQQITEIIIDLNDQHGIAPAEMEKYNALHRGEFFKLRIDNVNTYLFDVSVTNDDVDLTAPLPENILDLVDFGGLKTSLGNLNSVSEVVRGFVASKPAAGLQVIDPAQVQTLESLEEYFDGLESNYAAAFSEIDGQYAEVDALFVKAENYQNAMTTVERNVLGAAPSKTDVTALLDSFAESKGRLLAIKDELNLQNLKFLTVVETNNATIAKDKVLKASTATIKKAYDGLAKASDGLIDQLSAKNYAEFSGVLIGILNNLDFSYTTLPIQRYEEVNEMLISLKPRDKNSRLSGYSTVLRIPDVEKSFWGVSTGFYVTGNPERNYSVVAREENGQTLYDFLDEDTAEVELGINTMVRYGHRVGEVFDTPTFWHFGFGAGLSIDQKFKPRLMAGTGFAFGGKNKLFLDVGAIHMYYDTLSRAYDLRGNTVLPEDFLVGTTKVQGYFSVGYLISL